MAGGLAQYSFPLQPTGAAAPGASQHRDVQGGGVLDRYKDHDDVINDDDDVINRDDDVINDDDHDDGDDDGDNDGQ